MGFYFEKKRAIATGLAVCGSGIGTFIFAPLCNYLVEEYTWKGATLILAGEYSWKGATLILAGEYTWKGATLILAGEYSWKGATLILAGYIKEARI